MLREGCAQKSAPEPPHIWCAGPRNQCPHGTRHCQLVPPHTHPHTQTWQAPTQTTAWPRHARQKMQHCQEHGNLLDGPVDGGWSGALPQLGTAVRQPTTSATASTMPFHPQRGGGLMVPCCSQRPPRPATDRQFLHTCRQKHAAGCSRTRAEWQGQCDGSRGPQKAVSCVNNKTRAPSSPKHICYGMVVCPSSQVCPWWPQRAPQPGVVIVGAIASFSYMYVHMQAVCVMEKNA